MNEDRTTTSAEIATIGDRIVAAIEAAWNEQCCGFRSPSCESCRTYDDAIGVVRSVVANG